MPGGPHQMGAKNSSIDACLLNIVVSSALQAQTDRPFSSRIILGLDSAQPLHHIARLFKRSLGNELVVKSLLRNVQVCHDCSFYPNFTGFSLTPSLCRNPSLRPPPRRASGCEPGARASHQGLLVGCLL